jgi:hypothetical protein
MDFTVWKVEKGRNVTRGSWYTYSLRAHKNQPVTVLSEEVFAALFPGIELSLIPEAPKTIVISIEARI